MSFINKWGGGGRDPNKHWVVGKKLKKLPSARRGTFSWHSRILRSVSIENKLLRKMSNTKKNPTRKREIEIRVRHYKTHILRMIKLSKAKHFDNCFSQKTYQIWLKHGKVFVKLFT